MVTRPKACYGACRPTASVRMSPAHLRVAGGAASGPRVPVAVLPAHLKLWHHQCCPTSDGTAAGGGGVDVPAVKARLTAYRHRALAATLVTRRLAPSAADRAALDEQLGLLHFDQVPEVDMFS